ncbi:RDD family protein [Altererythrobacter sp. KTW20L]|uniref:RDD family protein n=1 Tax=Altererythrobacter sp. KTW20L TaxID=2942210 RepID=UPI0020C00307|nr:RDD family protein [Altererythrobacter sp. KTW20L]MCL6251404.1 RDD family protein [Altererythrobacter sp. KTW20L]
MSAEKSGRRYQASLASRRREMVTPEGLALPVTVAGRGARAGALLLDMIILFGGAFVVLLVLVAFGEGLAGNRSGEGQSPAEELATVALIMAFWLARYGYFLFFELGPRGATPGKRLMGIRVAARPSASNADAGGGRLTAEAVIARNLLRDIEVFLPTFYLLGMLASGGQADGVMGWAAFVWLMVFLLFPLFNKDRLRGGDLVAGTWVIEASRVRLAQAMSIAPNHGRDYRFGDAELRVYGEHELQVLEGVLRQDNPEAMREVMLAICRKIGWEPGAGHEREFLEAFYSALRAHLERGMRFGQRKADKHS